MKIPNDVARKIDAGECNDHWVVLKDGTEIFAHQMHTHPLSDNIIVVIHKTESYAYGESKVESQQHFVKWDRVAKIVG